MAFSYQMTFGEVPFCGDTATVYRMPMKVPEGEESTKEGMAPFKHQPMTELLEELDRLIPFRNIHDLPGMGYLSKNLCSIAHKNPPNVDPSHNVHINDFYYPNCITRWGVFRGLVTSTNVKEMLKLTRGTDPLEFVMKCMPSSASNGSSTADYTITTEMYMLPPHNLVEHGGRFDGLYLVTLVDDRYYLQDYVATLHYAQDAVWADLLDDLAAVLGITLTYDDVEEVYSRPDGDSQLWTTNESATVLLDAVAFNIGRVVVRKLDGTYELQSVDDAYSTVLLNRGSVNSVVRVAGGSFFENPNPFPVGSLEEAKNSAVPSQVQVNFPYYVTQDPQGNIPHLLNARTTNQRPSTWTEDAHGGLFSVFVPIRSGGIYVSGKAGTGTAQIYDTAKALISGEIHAVSGLDPYNASGLTALAMKLAQDRYGFLAAASLDEVYPGVYNWEPDGIHDIVWTISEKRHGAFTRVLRSPWSQSIDYFQHAMPELSGVYTTVAFGVGGKSVPQTVRDSYGASGTFVGMSGASRTIRAKLTTKLFSGDAYAILNGVDFLPTQNRWRAQIVSSGFNLSGLPYIAREVVLFEGTSGGMYFISVGGAPVLVSPGYSPGIEEPLPRQLAVQIVQRGVDGTFIPEQHNVSGEVWEVLPDTVYGANVVSHEKGQFNFHKAWTSGGVQEVSIVPQTQSVFVLDGSGAIINHRLMQSGVLNTFDPTRVSGQWVLNEYVWVTERNTNIFANSGLLHSGNLSGGSISGQVSYSGMYFSGLNQSGHNFGPLLSGCRFDGQLVGFSIRESGKVSAPVYAVDMGGGADGTFLAQLVEKNYSGNTIRYYWWPVQDVIATTEITGEPYLDYEIINENDYWNNYLVKPPCFHEQNIDLPVFPLLPFEVGGTTYSGGGIQPLSIVRLRQGAGNFYLCNQKPWEDLFRRTSDSDAQGVVAYHYFYNQNTSAFQDGQEVRLIVPS